MKPIQAYYPLLSQKQHIVITMHQKPDGDAMGATLGLYHFLSALGHDVQVIAPTNWANFLSWMPGVEKVWNYETNVKKSNSKIALADTIFCLDFNVLHRTKDMEEVLMKAKCVKILIDHHRQPQEEVFTYGVSDIHKSSTCEMVYDFIQVSPFAHLMNVDIATCLYTGIMTDTGSFRFPSTTASVHKTIAHLMEIGINHVAIHENIYDSYTESRLKFLGNTLLNRIEVFPQYNVALMVIPASDLLENDVQTGDTEGFVNYLLAIAGIKLGAIVTDRNEERKWSFRSKGDFDVNTFARQHFNGGGHKNAAGGRSFDTIEATVEKFKALLPEYEKELNKD